MHERRRSKVLVKEDKIKESRRNYFEDLYNGSHVDDLGCLTSSLRIKILNIHIQLEYLKEAMKKINIEKMAGSNGIPI